MNELDEAGLERLVILAEECAEVIQVINKIIRFGYNSFHPEKALDNRDLLEKELGDVQLILSMMSSSGDISYSKVVDCMNVKSQTINDFLIYNKLTFEEKDDG